MVASLNELLPEIDSNFGKDILVKLALLKFELPLIVVKLAKEAEFKVE